MGFKKKQKNDAFCHAEKGTHGARAGAHFVLPLSLPSPLANRCFSNFNLRVRRTILYTITKQKRSQRARARARARARRLGLGLGLNWVRYCMLNACEHDAQESVRGHDDVGGRAQKRTRRVCWTTQNRTETTTPVAALNAATRDPKQ